MLNSVGEIEEEKRLWTQCNELLKSDKKLTRSYVTSMIIHLAALSFVTISVSINGIYKAIIMAEVRIQLFLSYVLL